MSKEWKPGNWAMVQVSAGPDGVLNLNEEDTHIASSAFGNWRIPADCLHPLPTTAPSAEAQAALDAFLRHYDVRRRNGQGFPHEVVAAVDAYRASIAPPDPVAELRAAIIHERIVKNQETPDPRDWSNALARTNAALAAVEAARGGK